MARRAQSSLEFLFTFAIGFSLIIILGGLFITYSQGAKESLDKSQIEKIGNEIVFNVEKIYFLGEGNRISLNIRFPFGIDNFTIYHNENVTEGFDYLNISYLNDGEIVSSVFTTTELYTRFDCTLCFVDPLTNISYYNISDFSEGPKVIRLTSQGDVVSVDFFKGD